MRREERVTVQGPVKEQQPNGMSHRGGGSSQRAVLTPPPPSVESPPTLSRSAFEVEWDNRSTGLLCFLIPRPLSSTACHEAFASSQRSVPKKEKSACDVEQFKQLIGIRKVEVGLA